VPARVVDRLEVVEIDQHQGQRDAHRLRAVQQVVEPVEDVAAVVQAGQRVGQRGQQRAVVRGAQRGLVRLQRCHVAHHHEQPAVGLQRLGHPGPAAVDEIALEQAHRHLAVAAAHAGDPGVDVVGDDGHATPPRVAVAQQLFPGGRALEAGIEVDQERRVRVAQPLLRIEQRPRDGAGAQRGQQCVAQRGGIVHFVPNSRSPASPRPGTM
jgi:hypothetical protein